MKARILHLIDHTASGGAQVVLDDIVRGLSTEFSFSVAILGRTGVFSESYRSLDVPIFELGGHSGKWSFMPLYNLYNLLHQQTPDIVHAHLFKSYIFATLLPRIKHAPRIVLHDHTGVYQDSLKHYFNRSLLRSAYLTAYRHALHNSDHVFVLTETDRRQYLFDYGTKFLEKISVLPNSMDANRFESSVLSHNSLSIRQQLDLPANTRLVGVVARLEKEKDHITFLRVCQQIDIKRNGDVAFLVIGEGSEETRLRNFVKREAIPGVFFLGYRQDIQTLLSQIDVFLLTSLRESFSIAVLEAMAAGCPVVSTRSGGPDSIITHGKDGLLSNCGDINSLTQNVIELLDNKTLRWIIAKEALNTVKTRHSRETFLSTIRNRYLNLVSLK